MDFGFLSRQEERSKKLQTLVGRVPQGQELTDKWPVLSYGPTPGFDPKTWSFEVIGLVDNPLRLSYQEFMSLPKVTIGADFHCVTGWSKLDNLWEGVSFRELAKLAKPKVEAKHVMVSCDGGYTTNLPLDVLIDDDVLFAYRHNGEDLTADHGWPLRLVVPKRYAWKSAKWVRGLEFMAEDQRGFWERYGYHNSGDPWKEERYSWQE